MTESVEAIVSALTTIGTLSPTAIFAGMWWLERKEKQELIRKVDKLYGLLESS